MSGGTLFGGDKIRYDTVTYTGTTLRMIGSMFATFFLKHLGTVSTAYGELHQCSVIHSKMCAEDQCAANFNAVLDGGLQSS